MILRQTYEDALRFFIYTVFATFFAIFMCNLFDALRIVKAKGYFTLDK